jgi:carbon monoxide dehydrogenase subunit G
MARTTIEVDAAPDAVWQVLADASAFGDWVVGTSGISRADATWPQPGSALE